MLNKLRLTRDLMVLLTRKSVCFGLLAGLIFSSTLPAIATPSDTLTLFIEAIKNRNSREIRELLPAFQKYVQAARVSHDLPILSEILQILARAVDALGEWNSETMILYEKIKIDQQVRIAPSRPHLLE